MDLGLTDKVAIVTGAGTGIGLAIAEVLVEEGARVVAVDLDPSGAAELADDVVTIEADLGAIDAAERIVEQTVSRCGRIDILVNNVGIYPSRDGFASVSDAEWERVFQVNFFGIVRMCRAAIPHMIESGSGSILTTTSDLGRSPSSAFVDYCCTKAALLTLSKALSIEYGPKGIRSNCICPGPTRTEAWEAPGGFADWLSEQFDLDHEAAIEHYARNVRHMALGIVLPDSIARAAAFLVSPAATHVTGAEYRVDSGRATFV